MRERFKNYVTAFQLTRKHDPKLLWWLVPALLLPLILGGALHYYTGAWMYSVTGVLGAMVAVMWVFGWRSQRVQMNALRGNLGAAAAVLENMRGSWEFTPTVAFNRKQDFVHLVVGRPGIILVAEAGSPSRGKQMLAQEKRRFERAAGDVPVHTILVGTGPDEVDIAKLTTHCAKLRIAIKRNEIGPLNRRLSALSSSKLPMPKGPVGNLKMPKNMR